MKFAVDGTAIPDPKEFSGVDSDLDVSAERTADGLLHRDKVAEKLPLEIGYRVIDIKMLSFIMQLIKREKFAFTFFDPGMAAVRTITAYSNNRTWNCVWLPEGELPEGWYADLSFPVIEY